jgi:hypothetical protein
LIAVEEEMKIGPFLDLWVLSLHRGHAIPLCIVPILSYFSEETTISSSYQYMYSLLTMPLIHMSFEHTYVPQITPMIFVARISLYYVCAQ